MVKFKNKAIGIQVLSGIFVLGNLIVFIRWLLPAYFTPYLFLIPAYFMLLAISLLFILSQFKRRNLPPVRQTALLLLLNVAQMILSFFLMFCYFYFIKEQKYTMLIVFCIFYLVFMGLRTHLFTKFAK